MKRIITLVVEDGNTPHTEVEAFSKESANIFIVAKDIDTALTLLEAGREEADNACAIWDGPEPKPQEEKPQKHYKISRIATEDIEEGLQEYREDAKGQKMIKSIMAASDFRYKQGDTGLRISEFNYLYLLTNKDIWEGLLAMFSLGFRRGFNNAKRKYKA